MKFIYAGKGTGRYWPKRQPENGLINWEKMTAKQVYDFTRALTKPYPGAFTFVNGKKLYIWKIRILEQKSSDLPGRIVRVKKNGVIISTCGKQVLLSDCQFKGLSRRESLKLLKERTGEYFKQKKTKLTYTKLKDFKIIFQKQGAYHVSPRGFKGWFLRDNYRAIAEECNPNDVVLDIGCGEGCLGEYLEVKKLIGVDYSQVALDLCQQLYPGVYDDLLLGDLRRLEALSLPKESFSLIICSLSLMYLIGSDLTKCLKQTYRLLKPKGYFVFTYPTVGPLRKGNEEAAELQPHVLQEEIKKAGFTIEKIKPIVPLISEETVKNSFFKGKAKKAFKQYLRTKKRMTLESSYHFLGKARK